MRLKAPTFCFYPKQIAGLEFDLINLCFDLPSCIDGSGTAPGLPPRKYQASKSFEDQLTRGSAHNVQHEFASRSFVADMDGGQRGVVKRKRVELHR